MKPVCRSVHLNIQSKVSLRLRPLAVAGGRATDLRQAELPQPSLYSSFNLSKLRHEALHPFLFYGQGEIKTGDYLNQQYI